MIDNLELTLGFFILVSIGLVVGALVGLIPYIMMRRRGKKVMAAIMLVVFMLLGIFVALAFTIVV